MLSEISLPAPRIARLSKPPWNKSSSIACSISSTVRSQPAFFVGTRELDRLIDSPRTRRPRGLERFGTVCPDGTGFGDAVRSSRHHGNAGQAINRVCYSAYASLVHKKWVRMVRDHEAAPDLHGSVIGPWPLVWLEFSLESEEGVLQDMRCTTIRPVTQVCCDLDEFGGERIRLII